jgi:acetylornithine deacetylase/succinyl-diaminopimelate desuccinylase-like protein
MNPFSGELRDGKVYGRGSTDQKSGIGLGYLVEEGYIGRGRQDYVVITECLDVDGICLGHRGALFFRSPSQRCGIEFTERYAAEPVLVSADNELVRTYAKEISSVLGRESRLLLSPGIDDQRFVVRDGQIDSCVLYGPGVLSMAHAPDEFVPVQDLVNSAKVMAFSTLDLLGAE